MGRKSLKLLFILFGLLYLVFPLDIIPDAAGIFGRIDDLIFAAFLIWQYRRIIAARMGQAQTKAANAESAKSSANWQKPSGDAGPKTYARPMAHQILGVAPNATQQEIQQAYKREASKYHPDKVAHLGEELKKLAHQKMIEIQDAYSELSAKSNY